MVWQATRQLTSHQRFATVQFDTHGAANLEKWTAVCIEFIKMKQFVQKI